MPNSFIYGYNKPCIPYFNATLYKFCNVPTTTVRGRFINDRIAYSIYVYWFQNHKCLETHFIGSCTHFSHKFQTDVWLYWWKSDIYTKNNVSISLYCWSVLQVIYLEVRNYIYMWKILKDFICDLVHTLTIHVSQLTFQTHFKVKTSQMNAKLLDLNQVWHESKRIFITSSFHRSNKKWCCGIKLPVYVEEHWVHWVCLIQMYFSHELVL